MTTILYPEFLYADESVEREIYGPDVRILKHIADSVADLPDEDCAEAEGLMVFRHFLNADDLARFPRLRCIVRMGVGYDRVDRAAAAARRHGVQRAGLRDDGSRRQRHRADRGAAARAVPVS